MNFLGAHQHRAGALGGASWCRAKRAASRKTWAFRGTRLACHTHFPECVSAALFFAPAALKPHFARHRDDRRELDGGGRLERRELKDGQGDAQERFTRRLGHALHFARRDEIDEREHLRIGGVFDLDDADAADFQLAADGLGGAGDDFTVDALEHDLIVGDEKRGLDGRRPAPRQEQEAQGEIGLAAARRSPDQDSGATERDARPVDRQVAGFRCVGQQSVLPSSRQRPRPAGAP